MPRGANSTSAGRLTGSRVEVTGIPRPTSVETAMVCALCHLRGIAAGFALRDGLTLPLPLDS